MGQKSKFRVTSARQPLATEADISSLMARTRQRQHDAKSPPGHAGRSEVWSGHEVRELISGAAYPRLCAGPDRRVGHSSALPTRCTGFPGLR